jgi:hypothetical protein
VCNIPECSSGDWTGGVISWPEGTAYSSNNRTSDNSRTVYSMSGQLLYPYMGSWAHGCQLTIVDGAVLVIEWKPASNTWRQTLVSAGESYTINLVGEEDGAMIETRKQHHALQPQAAELHASAPDALSVPVLPSGPHAIPGSVRGLWSPATDRPTLSAP